MTEEQLHLLRSLRPHGEDDHETGVPEARAAADAAGISVHLEDEHGTDLAMRSALDQIEPPPGFEDALRIAMRAARGIGEPPAELRDSILTAVQLPQGPQPLAHPRWSRRRWLGWGSGIAASLALGGKWWWENQAFSLARLSRELATITRKGISLSLMSNDKLAVSAWLTANNAPRPETLPVKLDGLGRKGCHLYQIDGHPVSLQCFLLPDMKQLHLYCTPSSGLINPPHAGVPVALSKQADLTFAIWAQGQQTILLLSREPEDLIRSLIS